MESTGLGDMSTVKNNNSSYKSTGYLSCIACINTHVQERQ